MKINGNLLFDGTGQIENLRVEKLAHTAVPAAAAGDVARIIFVTSAGTTAAGTFLANTLYQGTPVTGGGYTWRAIAGNLQEELDETQASLGSFINSDGTFNAAAFTTANSTVWATAPSSLMNALDVLSDAFSAKDTLDEIFPQSATGNVIYSNGTSWLQAAPGQTSGVQPYDAELAALAGVVSGADVLPYFTGSGAATGTTLTAYGRDLIDSVDATGARATLNLVIGTDVQAYDAGLASLASLTGPGLVALDAAGNVMSARSLVAPAAGFTITNADGSGNPTFVLANDLAAYEGLATSGMVVRTGNGTATTRTIGGQAGRIVVSNGDGVASAPTVDLATVSQVTGGTFLKVTLDGYGRVTENAAVTNADIRALVDATYVDATGDTMSGTLNMGNNLITGLAAPSGDTDATNKAYVDSLTTGLSWKNAVRVATTAAITIASPGAAIDGVDLSNGDRVLVKNQGTASENGIYLFNGATSAMTRADDMNAAAEFDGAAVYVKEGTQWESTGWTQTATVGTVGTSAVTWVQFSGANLYTWGTGLGNTGNTIFLNLGAGISELPSDQVGIDLWAPTGGGLVLTENGTAASTGAAAKLHLKLKESGGLTQDGDGLYVPANGITNAMIENESLSLNGDSGSTGTIALGGTLQVQGTSAQGINTSVTGSTFTLTASDASASQKGVASFNATEFTLTAGDVVLATGGIANTKLANKSITFAGNSGSDAVDLGETLTITGSGAMSVTAGTANNMTVSVALATTGAVGVASFAAADFTVVAGAVSVIAKDLNNLTDVTITSATGGQTLVNNGAGQFVNRKVYHNHTQSAAASTWTVTHDLGQQFCNVTVYDGSNQVIIPNTITFTSSSALEVTFTTSITGGVVVMGVNAGAGA